MISTLFLATTWFGMRAVTTTFAEELYEYSLPLNIILPTVTGIVGVTHLAQTEFLAGMAVLALNLVPNKPKPLALGAITPFLTPILGVPLLVAQAASPGTRWGAHAYAGSFLVVTVILLL